MPEEVRRELFTRVLNNRFRQVEQMLAGGMCAGQIYIHILLSFLLHMFSIGFSSPSVRSFNLPFPSFLFLLFYSLPLSLFLSSLARPTPNIHTPLQTSHAHPPTHPPTHTHTHTQALRSMYTTNVATHRCTSHARPTTRRWPNCVCAGAPNSMRRTRRVRCAQGQSYTLPKQQQLQSSKSNHGQATRQIFRFLFDF